MQGDELLSSITGDSVQNPLDLPVFRAGPSATSGVATHAPEQRCGKPRLHGRGICRRKLGDNGCPYHGQTGHPCLRPDHARKIDRALHPRLPLVKRAGRMVILFLMSAGSQTREPRYAPEFAYRGSAVYRPTLNSTICRRTVIRSGASSQALRLQEIRASARAAGDTGLPVLETAEARWSATVRPHLRCSRVVPAWGWWCRSSCVPFLNRALRGSDALCCGFAPGCALRVDLGKAVARRTVNNPGDVPDTHPHRSRDYMSRWPSTVAIALASREVERDVWLRPSRRGRTGPQIRCTESTQFNSRPVLPVTLASQIGFSGRLGANGAAVHHRGVHEGRKPRRDRGFVFHADILRSPLLA